MLNQLCYIANSEAAAKPSLTQLSNTYIQVPCACAAITHKQEFSFHKFKIDGVIYISSHNRLERFGFFLLVATLWEPTTTPWKDEFSTESLSLSHSYARSFECDRYILNTGRFPCRPSWSALARELGRGEKAMCNMMQKKELPLPSLQAKTEYLGNSNVFN